MNQKKFSELPISILDLALILEGKSPSDAFSASLDLAQNADKLGYTRYWLAEHHNMESVASSATVVLIGFIAGGTKSIRVGSGGIMLPNHAPLIVAEQFGTLSSLYSNRIDMGLGRAPGTDQLTARALRRDHQAVLGFPDSIKEIQSYLSKDNSNSKVRAIVGEGQDIPIWILGSSVSSAYLAAELGLPYAFASHFAPAELFNAMTIYRKNFIPSSQLQQPYFMPCINIIAAETNEEAEFLATSSNMLVLGILTNNRRPLQKPNEDFVLSEMEEAALQQMTAYSIMGDRAKVKNQLQAFASQTEADEIMITSHIYDQKARIHSYELIRQVKLES